MKFASFIATTILAASLALASPDVRAQDAAVPVIVVVDIQQIQQNAAAYEDIQRQLEAQREVYQEEISVQEEKLRSADQELNRQRAILSSEAFAQKRQEFDQQVADIQRAVQARKRALDQGYNNAMGQVRSALLQIVADVAGERKANLVLAKQQVLLVEQSLDLTDIVMERLNEKLPSVKVTIPDPKS